MNYTLEEVKNAVKSYFEGNGTKTNIEVAVANTGYGYYHLFISFSLGKDDDTKYCYFFRLNESSLAIKRMRAYKMEFLEIYDFGTLTNYDLHIMEVVERALIQLRIDKDE